MSDGFRGQTFAWFVVEEGGVGRYRAWASGLPRGRWHSSRRPSQEPDDHEFDGSRSGGPRWLIQNSSAGRAVGGEQGCRPHLLRDEYRCGCGKFGTKRPQVQIQSPRPVPQVSDLRKCRASVACVPLQPPSRRPEGTKKEHEGTPGKAGADFDRQKNTRPPRTAQQTPRQSRDPQGTLIPRPQRRGRLVGRPARQEAVPIRIRQARQARDRQRAPPSAEDQVDPSALNDGIGQDVRMVRIVLWWTGLAASVLLVVAAFGSQSGACVDSSNAAASSCSSQGSGGLFLFGLAAFALWSWMLRRAYRVRRFGDATR
jgi:hypothetical protein